MIRAAIIDDEDHARENLRTILKTNFDNIKIVGEANSMKSAIQLIKIQKLDLLFLDIDLSDGSGFNVLDEIEECDFHVIFVTAFNQFAIQAFRYNALDYILKPIDLGILQEAIARVKEGDDEYITQKNLKELMSTFTSNEEDKKIVVKNKNSRSYVRVGDIVCCVADGSYTTLHLINNEKIVVSRVLKSFSTMLPDTLFFRVHQSSLVNLNYVKEYSNLHGGMIIMENGTEILIARRRKDEFLEALEEVVSI